MTDLTEMWRELERYQPYADKRGFGEAWKRMTTERTPGAAAAAGETAWAARHAASDAAWTAVAAAWAAGAAGDATWAAAWAQLAIENIRAAIEQEQT